jgi:hypothetical protein
MTADAETGQGDVRKLQGPGNRWRLRVGDWRVIFVFAPPGSITVLAAATRTALSRALPAAPPRCAGRSSSKHASYRRAGHHAPPLGFSALVDPYSVLRLLRLQPGRLKD